MSQRITILIFATLLLAACGSTPQRKAEVPIATTEPSGGGYLPGDGPGADVPVNLDAIPDATPREEPLHRYANRPYKALGKSYTPLTVAGKYKERGIASWYGKKFHGRHTSSGEIYDMYAMTAAHPTLPLPSYARVTNPANQKSVIVRINDRGPFLHERIIDLSFAAAYKLGIIDSGSAEVEVESLASHNSDTYTNPSVTRIAANTVQTQPLESSPSVAIPAAMPAVAMPAVAILAPDTGSSEVYLQLGAFESQQNADTFLARMSSELGNELSNTGKQLKLTSKGGIARVHIGPYANQSEARSSAESLAGKLGFKPMVNLP